MKGYYGGWTPRSSGDSALSIVRSGVVPQVSGLAGASFAFRISDSDLHFGFGFRISDWPSRFYSKSGLIEDS